MIVRTAKYVKYACCEGKSTVSKQENARLRDLSAKFLSKPGGSVEDLYHSNCKWVCLVRFIQAIFRAVFAAMS